MRKKVWVSIALLVGLLGIGVATTDYAVANSVSKAARWKQLREQVEIEEQKFANMKSPNLDEVGETEYVKAVREINAQGQRVKEMQFELGKLQNELYPPAKQPDEQILQEELRHAEMMLAEAEGKVKRLPDSPDNPRLLAIIEKGKPIVERIRRDHKEGEKSATDLLKNLDEYKALWH